jgi:hypothetical protein
MNNSLADKYFTKTEKGQFLLDLEGKKCIKNLNDYFNNQNLIKAKSHIKYLSLLDVKILYTLTITMVIHFVSNNLEYSEQPTTSFLIKVEKKKIIKELRYQLDKCDYKKNNKLKK